MHADRCASEQFVKTGTDLLKLPKSVYRSFSLTAHGPRN
jgi:hypothetical protein